MLDTLFESRAAKARSNQGTLVSAAIHLGLIALATYFTTTRVAATPVPDPVVTLTWVKPALSPAPAPRRASSSNAARSRSAAPEPISVSFNVPSELPPVNLELGPVRSDDFPAPSSGTPSDAPAGTPRGDSEAYDAIDVDTQVRAIAGSGFPKYPPGMRASGVEGQVVAQFVVDERGRAVASSIRIISSTNDLFSESVRDAITRMRFMPARLAGKPVPQTVQQLFVFKLDR